MAQVRAPGGGGEGDEGKKVDCGMNDCDVDQSIYHEGAIGSPMHDDATDDRTAKDCMIGSGITHGDVIDGGDDAEPDCSSSDAKKPEPSGWREIMNESEKPSKLSKKGIEGFSTESEEDDPSTSSFSEEGDQRGADESTGRKDRRKSREEADQDYDKMSDKMGEKRRSSNRKEKQEVTSSRSSVDGGSKQRRKSSVGRRDGSQRRRASSKSTASNDSHSDRVSFQDAVNVHDGENQNTHIHFLSDGNEARYHYYRDVEDGNDDDEHDDYSVGLTYASSEYLDSVSGRDTCTLAPSSTMSSSTSSSSKYLSEYTSSSCRSMSTFSSSSISSSTTSSRSSSTSSSSSRSSSTSSSSSRNSSIYSVFNSKQRLEVNPYGDADLDSRYSSLDDSLGVNGDRNITSTSHMFGIGMGQGSPSNYGDARIAASCSDARGSIDDRIVDGRSADGSVDSSADGSVDSTLDGVPDNGGRDAGRRRGHDENFRIRVGNEDGSGGDGDSNGLINLQLQSGMMSLLSFFMGDETPGTRPREETPKFIRRSTTSSDVDSDFEDHSDVLLEDDVDYNLEKFSAEEGKISHDQSGDATHANGDGAPLNAQGPAGGSFGLGSVSIPAHTPDGLDNREVSCLVNAAADDLPTDATASQESQLSILPITPLSPASTPPTSTALPVSTSPTSTLPTSTSPTSSSLTSSSLVLGKLPTPPLSPKSPSTPTSPSGSRLFPPAKIASSPHESRLRQLSAQNIPKIRLSEMKIPVKDGRAVDDKAMRDDYIEFSSSSSVSPSSNLGSNERESNESSVPFLTTLLSTSLSGILSPSNNEGLPPNRGRRKKDGTRVNSRNRDHSPRERSDMGSNEGYGLDRSDDSNDEKNRDNTITVVGSGQRELEEDEEKGKNPFGVASGDGWTSFASFAFLFPFQVQAGEQEESSSNCQNDKNRQPHDDGDVGLDSNDNDKNINISNNSGNSSGGNKTYSRESASGDSNAKSSGYSPRHTHHHRHHHHHRQNQKHSKNHPHHNHRRTFGGFINPPGEDEGDTSESSDDGHRYVLDHDMSMNILVDSVFSTGSESPTQSLIQSILFNEREQQKKEREKIERGILDDTSKIINDTKGATGDSMVGIHMVGENMVGDNMVGDNLVGDNMIDDNIVGGDMDDGDMARRNLTGGQKAVTEMAGSEMAGSEMGGSDVAGEGELSDDASGEKPFKVSTDARQGTIGESSQKGVSHSAGHIGSVSIVSSMSGSLRSSSSTSREKAQDRPFSAPHIDLTLSPPSSPRDSSLPARSLTSKASLSAPSCPSLPHAFKVSARKKVFLEDLKKIEEAKTKFENPLIHQLEEEHEAQNSGGYTSSKNENQSYQHTVSVFDRMIMSDELERKVMDAVLTQSGTAGDFLTQPFRSLLSSVNSETPK